MEIKGFGSSGKIRLQICILTLYSSLTCHYVRVCSSTGSWSGLTPSCRPISCGPPPSLASNTLVELLNSSTHWQAVAAYTCMPGYTDTGEHKEGEGFLSYQISEWEEIPSSFIFIEEPNLFRIIAIFSPLRTY